VLKVREKIGGYMRSGRAGVESEGKDRACKRRGWAGLRSNNGQTKQRRIKRLYGIEVYKWYIEMKKVDDNYDTEW
jgi:hypothetical protein